MIACICFNISLSQIQELKEKGLSWSEIQQVLGIGKDCGVCLQAAEKLGSD